VSLQHRLLAAAFTLLPPVASSAQWSFDLGSRESRAWQYCFRAPFVSCLQFRLTTTPTHDATGAYRNGTDYQVDVRNLQGTLPEANVYASGLHYLEFSYGSPSGGERLGFNNLTGASRQPPWLRNGATPPGSGRLNLWQASAASRSAPMPYWHLSSNVSLAAELNFQGVGTPTPHNDAAWIAGCTAPPGGLFLSNVGSVNTCGSAFVTFAFWSPAILDASQFRTVMLNDMVRETPDAPATGQHGQRACNAGLDGTWSDAWDQYGPVSGGCAVVPLDPDGFETWTPSTVPEPATGALVAAGLAAAAAAGWRRRRASR
jgi:hypothetical protein